jgi:D-ribose pyranose/furanose isomerase RbsD
VQAEAIPEIFKSIGTALVSGIVGFLGAVAVFRSRFDVADEKRNALAREIERDREHDKAMLEVELAQMRESINRQCKASEDAFVRVERRQLVALEITAHVARKLNVSHRALGVDGLAALMDDGDK